MHTCTFRRVFLQDHLPLRRERQHYILLIALFQSEFPEKRADNARETELLRIMPAISDASEYTMTVCITIDITRAHILIS